MILIVANEFDVHADAVILALKELKFKKLMRLDFETVLDRYSFEVGSKLNEACWRLAQSAAPTTINLDKITTVWWRRASSQIRTDYLELPNQDSLDKSEAYWGARWFVESLDVRKFPFGHPYSMRNGNNKLTQLSVAQKLGLLVPKYILSNKKESILKFASDCKVVVIKPIHAPIVVFEEKGQSRELSLLSTSKTAHELQEILDKYESTFLFAQEKIDKKYDVRVNIFPNHAVACRIDPSPEMKDVDWRPSTGSCPHTIIDLPEVVEMSCRRFLRHMDLKWGAFDFGIDDRGLWYFFECNPNGQWLWIELMTKYPISRLLANELINHHSISAF